MFSQNSLGTVYYISINKGRPGRGAPRTPGGKQRKRDHDICIWKGQSKYFPCCVTNRLGENAHTGSGVATSQAPYLKRKISQTVSDDGRNEESGLLDKVYSPEFSRNLAGFSFHLAPLQSSCVFYFLAKSVNLFSMDSLSRGVRKRNWSSLQGSCAELGIKFIFRKHRLATAWYHDYSCMI